ncbi:FG-GAP-like repeat-containing protein [Streptomyces sp. ME02-8801-2C]|uniref:FG-GAP-like repeat-containing protein n=1 Tax=Streptomyces sp. ME02-8801-2C TaxID=3028680 RepID=UPI0029B19F8B|nr:FG-GAP-like repeat-containing protein [Streptomyces sp. ME02-8801-2C]MDX3458145.1 FG-GAP-like repeat-containing protein [Streptomyces sp. ME02-8801-2C]
MRNEKPNRYQKQSSKQFGKQYRKRTATGAVSVAAALAVVAGLLQFAAGPAVAADDGDMPSVTLTGAHRAAPRQAFLAAADSSGYLSVPSAYPGGSPARWIGRDGTIRDIPNRPYTTAYNGVLGLEKVPQTTNVHQIRHYPTGKVTRFYVPAGDRVTRVFAENRLLVSRQVEGKWTLHLLEMPAGGGTPVDRPVTGVADDFAGWMLEETSDTRGAAFWYKQADGGEPWRTALLDFDTAALTYVPSDDFGLLEYPHLAGDTVIFYALDKRFSNSRLYVIDRARPAAPGHLIDIPEDARLKARAIGDWVVYPDTAKNTILAVPVTGGPARTLLAASTGKFVDGDDGSFSIEGGTDAEHWAVQRVTLGTDGIPVFEAVAPLPAVSVYEAGGIAVDQGRVLLGTERADATSAYDGTHLSATALSLAADGTLTAAPPETLGDLGYEESNPDYSYHVDCYEECLRLTGTGESEIDRPAQEVSAVVAASASYRVLRTGRGKVEVRDGSKVLTTGSWPAAALWGNTLWTAGTDARGDTVFERSALPSMRRLGSLTPSGTCLPSDLQVVGRYVYWSCGPDADARVLDQVTGTEHDVPQGYARLGDGYLVTQDADLGKLLITYLPGAVPADRVGTQELGPLPSPAYAPADRRGRFWNVDPYGGPVAYQTASGDITVKWPQVTNSPFGAIHVDVPTSVNLRENSGFQGVWQLNRPATSWKLTIATSTGAPVRTVTGGVTRGTLTAVWDGRNEKGALVRTGTYRIRMTAQSANGTPTNVVLLDKQVPIRSVERHDFGRDGIGDLLTFDSAGRLAIQPGTGRGTIDTAHKVLGSGWPTSSAFVPFGEVTGDMCNDLLVRDSAGRLTRYEGTCGRAFTPRSPHRLLGTGFGGYNVLTSPGDLTGDGHPDLIARDRAGVLWRYAADGRGGLTARVKVVGGQGGYTRLIGAGDMNGDGIGDMVGLDRANVLWRWLGNGKGAFGSRTRIATGITVNALTVPGDLNGDGRPDLVGRDRSGALWRWNGTPSATLGTKTRIATGWNGYTGLY